MIATLSTLAARFLIVPIRSQRSASPTEIAPFVPQPLSATRCASAREALELAHGFKEQILVTGSLFLVGETLAVLDSTLSALQASNQ
jgi:folylpolyglutamate synthase/dihydropteroate synthase